MLLETKKCKSSFTLLWESFIPWLCAPVKESIQEAEVLNYGLLQSPTITPSLRIHWDRVAPALYYRNWTINDTSEAETQEEMRMQAYMM